MGIKYICDKCLTHFTSNAIVVEGTAFISDNLVSCPVRGCNGMGHHEPGYYEFVNGVMTAFTAPGMTREKVKAVRDIARRVEAGTLSRDEAKAMTAAHVPTAAKVWDLIGSNHNQLMILIAILSMLTSMASLFVAVSANAGSQSDQVMRQRQTEAQERIAAELVRMNLVPPAPEPSGLMPMRNPRPSQAQTMAPKNRAERRKAAAIARKNNIPSG